MQLPILALTHLSVGSYSVLVGTVFLRCRKYPKNYIDLTGYSREKATHVIVHYR